ncbi:MgtC/SapB family protein [Idiomarina xiamenensis]|uniref:Protein MgtC n=1 Tax=Idiomarina xiamenensis 10-D-4 TaxID=740709 RepID=K2L1L0_9GAMM|nr:MgtC/SapB family protein [Idiomarina xiamenensis]EKE83665.1 putative transport ATPase [Idiomarina xiamenensis 10-D-4]
MTSDSIVSIALHLFSALIAGGLIGAERGFHGRPAGFRTHALVCLASTALMLLTYYQWQWLPNVPLETIRTDPTRMAQGIMTGIGFLGAGVIFKEGGSVRGLTTAASVWSTAALGILIGAGMYWVAAISTLFILGTLSLFRWIEARLPGQLYANYCVGFARDQVMSEAALRQLLQEQGFSVANMSYRIVADGELFEYAMVIRTDHQRQFAKLALSMQKLAQVKSFHIMPTGD